MQTALEKVGGSTIAQPDSSNVMQIGTTHDKFTDGFNGVTLDLDKWDIVRNVGGMAMTVANGALAVNMGVDPAAELLLVAKQTVTIPANLILSFMMSQRIVGNDVSFGYLDVDPDTLTPVPHATLTAREFRNSVRKTFTGATTTSAALEAVSTDAPTLVSVAETTVTSTTMSDHSIYARADDISSTSQTSNSTASKSSGASRISTQVPSPNRVYRAFIHLRNTAVPATATTVTIARIVSLDIQELEVQASMGSGVNFASAGVPMLPVGAFPGGSNAVGGVAVIHSAATTTNGGATALLAQKTSSADTNLTLVKATAARFVGGVIRNKGAVEVFFKVYNRNTAPTAGLAPLLKIPIPAGSMVNLTEIIGPQGYILSAGLAYAITAGESDTDATVIGAGDVYVLVMYV